MDTEKHAAHTEELEDLTKVWGLGRVLQTRRGIQGEYVDVETGSKRCVFLGHSRYQAIARMNHVRSFL